MTKKITQAGHGAMLAKESLAIRVVPPIKLVDLENGNRLQRRVAEKQRRSEAKRLGATEK